VHNQAMKNDQPPKTIVFTGGGTAGHVTPNIAIMKPMSEQGWHCIYIGSKTGLEKSLIADQGIPYYGVSTGKFRRHFSLKTLVSPFKILLGIVESALLLRRLKPQAVFSKGSFVAFPVVVGAWLNRIPVYAHESDLTPGLANRLSFPFAKIIFVTFEQGKKFFKDQNKVKVSGAPIRGSLLTGNPSEGLKLCNFDSHKPVIMVIGGSLGADRINQCIRKILPNLLQHFQVAHVCGQGKTDSHFDGMTSYQQFDYVNDELPHLLACADMVISRGGSNAIYELLALQKPHLLIPLSKKYSRGDQIHNAEYFQQKGLSDVLDDDTLSPEKLQRAIQALWEKLPQRQQALASFELPNTLETICAELSLL